MTLSRLAAFWLVLLFFPLRSPSQDIEILPGTQPLNWEGDIASKLVEGVDRFLLRETEMSVARRGVHWKRDLSSPEKYAQSLAPQRERLAHILGVRDQREKLESLELVSSTSRPALRGRGPGYKIFAVRWPVVGGIEGEGLLLTPEDPSQRLADVIAIPDASVTPEMLAGLTPQTPPAMQYARRLVECGCRVLVPTIINRDIHPRNGRAKLTNREYLYRSSFEMGRHLIGYEIQKILAGVDWFENEAKKKDRVARVGVLGWGEGGLLALYAAALDPRIDAASVSGYFGSRQNLWKEPIDRNVFGLLEQFGDAELASMIVPRALVLDASKGPEIKLESVAGAAPGELVSFSWDDVANEVARVYGFMADAKFDANRGISLFQSEDLQGFSDGALAFLLNRLHPEAGLSQLLEEAENLQPDYDPGPRQLRQVAQIDAYNQHLLRESPSVRREFMKKLDTSSPEKFLESSDTYREHFRHEVIGHFEQDLSPLNPRTRKAYDKDAWTGYEVVLDVFPDVVAYGVLLMPRGIAEGEKRPVVVCQHGLEGRPQDTIEGDKRAYHDFSAKLAERGFIVFAPQNVYIFQDRFRTLQRKANPLKKTLFSVIVPQHQQIVNWLSTLPQVDPQRIGFYGLSYGGKSAMRIPPLVSQYSLSICSADFNDWIWKNASNRSRYSYLWTGEYEIFEFDLGQTYNYSEMAALIAPRPFMVERGHFDGVAPDERVAYEFAKVRHLYQARLKLPKGLCEIEWFDGPHTINGKGTFEFLHKHLKWRLPNAAP